MGRKTQYAFHGSPHRFEVVAMFLNEYFGNHVQYFADVAGGQGMLAKLLNKYNYDAEVIDPRGWRIKGVAGRAEEFNPSSASYYDVIVGLHPDEATRPIAEAAKERPTLIIPCCNFWSDEKLGRNELVEAIESYYDANNLEYQRIEFPFKGPKNLGILSFPDKNDNFAHHPDIDQILALITDNLNLK